MNHPDLKLQSGWNFDNSYSTKLPTLMFHSQPATPVRDPKLIILNEKLCEDLGLHSEWLKSDIGISELAGNQVPSGAFPLAQAYAGHQFGHFTMLGDGRALLLGEQMTPNGRRLDIQLKGSGLTPFSRGGDGRAALGPMLREYIMSEAMFALGIPTTRSLAVVSTGEKIQRETKLEGAILTRIASSHIRVGTFQFVSQWGSLEQLKELADYTIDRHFSHLINEQNGQSNISVTENLYLNFLYEVMDRQAKLIAKWQLVGFIHGVMNTDNMSIAGETIDYGPCAFMDQYNPTTVFSSIDRQGRYAYGNQPNIGLWNLARLAETLLPLFHDNEDEAIKIAENALQVFQDQYKFYYLSGMRAKLGIFNEVEADIELIHQLHEIMQMYQMDYTNTFRTLTLQKWENNSEFNTVKLKQWLVQWQQRLSRQSESIEQSFQLMKQHNPSIIPRNHRVEQALSAAVDHHDYTVLNQLLTALSQPYAYSADQEPYTTPAENTEVPYRTYCGT